MSAARSPTARPWRFIVIFQLFVFLAVLPQETTAAPSRHAGLSCQDCHFSQPSLAAAGLGPRLLKMSEERACGECHEGAREASHPSGFVPDRPLPAEFPLDQRGQMTCTTCHDFHAARSGKLRVAKSGREFCMSCHTAAFFERMPDRGRSIVASGHLDARARRLPSPVDAYSFRCIECHERNLSLPRDGFRVAFTANNATGMANHPIGEEYGPGASLRGFRPAAALASGILLPEGKVSCVSCHRGYSGQHGALVSSPNGLCQECHDM